MGGKRALGGGLAMATAAMGSLLGFSLFMGLLFGGLGGVLAAGFLSAFIAPVVFSSSLLAGVIVWWYLPRGWKYGAVGGGFASGLAYPISALIWAAIDVFTGYGTLADSISGGIAVAMFGFLLSAFITLPVGAVCGALYEAILQRYGERTATADAEKPAPSEQESAPNSLPPDEESRPNAQPADDELTPLEHRWP